MGDVGNWHREFRPAWGGPLEERVLLSSIALPAVVADAGVADAGDQRASEAGNALAIDPFVVYPNAAYYEAFARPAGWDFSQPQAASDGLVIARAEVKAGEAANAPIGLARGLNPGRVAWARDPAATNWDGTSGYYWTDDHTNQGVVGQMMGKAVRWLTSEATDAGAWDALFKHFNEQRGFGPVGYAPGERIAIKANLNEATLREDQDNFADLTPATLYALLDQLVNVGQVPQEDISVYDSIKLWSNKFYDRCHAAFPGVHFVDRVGGDGREQVQASTRALVHWSDGGKPDQLPTCVVDAKYMINLAIVKKHEMAGITGCGKNHYGSVVRTPSATGYYNLHASLPSEAPGMERYRALADLMGHEHLGGKTLLYLLDGIWGGWRSCIQGSEPTRWVTLENDWLSSIFASQDPVAMDSVLHDCLHAEEEAWMALGNAPRGGGWSTGRIRDEADDYLHEAAKCGTPGSRAYTPDGDGIRLASQGVHEHWNNDADRQYSRNLLTGAGIELVRSDPLAEVRPSVAVTWPVESANCPAGSSIGLAASAAVEGGDIVSVEFYANGALVGRDDDAADGWACDWPNVPGGEYSITAKAIDTRGVAAMSQPVNITVGVVVSVQEIRARVGERGPEPGMVIIRRSGEASGELNVDYVVGGTAKGGVDYETLPANLSIPAGENSATISIVAIDDPDAEGNETVTITLAPGDGYVVGRAAAGTVTLADDDAPAGAISGRVWSDNDGDGAQDTVEGGLFGWTAYVDQNHNGVFDTAATCDVVSTDMPRAIPDNNTTGVMSDLVVGGLVGSVVDVNVTLSITHRKDSDLRVYLIDPAGLTVTLFANLSANLSNFTCTVLDDQAYLAITAGPSWGGASGNTYSDRFRPVGKLSGFNGHDPNGTWKLRVADSAASNTGTLTAWSLRLVTAGVIEPSATTHADGTYTIAGLPAGTHEVRLARPRGWAAVWPADESHAVAIPAPGAGADVDFGEFPTVFGGSLDEDDYRVGMSAAGTRLEILRDASADGGPACSVDPSLIESLSFNPGAGADTLTIDLSAGTPSAPVPIVYNGSTGGDVMIVKGSVGDDVVTIGAGQVIAGTWVITHTGVAERRLALGAGRDTLTIDGCAFTFNTDASLETEHLTLNLANAASVAFNGTQHLAALSIGAGSAAAFTGTTTNALITGALSLAADASLDLHGGVLVVKGGDLGDISAWVRSARAGGAWNGPGITSSSAPGHEFLGIAAVLNDKGTGEGPFMMSLAGQSLSTADVIVKCTWNGDMNVDGVVNADDYFMIDTGFVTQKGGYQNGDLNYDAVVNADDYFLIDSAFLGQSEKLAAGTPTIPAQDGVLAVASARRQNFSGLTSQLFSIAPRL